MSQMADALLKAGLINAKQHDDAVRRAQGASDTSSSKKTPEVNSLEELRECGTTVSVFRKGAREFLVRRPELARRVCALGHEMFPNKDEPQNKKLHWQLMAAKNELPGCETDGQRKTLLKRLFRRHDATADQVGDRKKKKKKRKKKR